MILLKNILRQKLSHSAFVGKHSCAICFAFCPSRDTSSVKNGIKILVPCFDVINDRLFPEKYTITIYIYIFFQFSLLSQVSITRFYYLQEYNSKYINEGCAFSPI